MTFTVTAKKTVSSDKLVSLAAFFSIVTQGQEGCVTTLKTAVGETSDE